MPTTQENGNEMDMGDFMSEFFAIAAAGVAYTDVEPTRTEMNRDQSALLFSLVVFETCGRALSPEDICFKDGPASSIEIGGTAHSMVAVGGLIKNWLNGLFPERETYVFAGERAADDKGFSFSNFTIIGLSEEDAKNIFRRMNAYRRQRKKLLKNRSLHIDLCLL